MADAAAAADSYQRPPPRVMICNRGEIARRVIRTANQHGLDTVAIYTHVSPGGAEVLPAVTRRSAVHPSCLCVLGQALISTLSLLDPLGPAPNRLTRWHPMYVRPSTPCSWVRTPATTPTRRSCCR